MSDSKFYVMPESNDNAALYSALANNGGMGNWMNNPFAYMMFMPFLYGMANGGLGGWGNNRNGYGGALAGADMALGATTQANVANLGNLVQNLSGLILDTQSFNLINLGISNVDSAVGDLNGAMVGGFANIAQDINGVNTGILTTGCGIKSAVTEQGYLNQLANCQQTNTILQGNLGLNNTIQNGFTQLGFQLERNACDVKETSTANTQKIVDTLNGHWNLELQNKITLLLDQLTTLQLTNALIAALGGGATKAVTN